MRTSTIFKSLVETDDLSYLAECLLNEFDGQIQVLFTKDQIPEQFISSKAEDVKVVESPRGKRMAKIQNRVEGAQMRVLDVLTERLRDGVDNEETQKLIVAKNLLNGALHHIENDTWLPDET